MELPALYKKTSTGAIQSWLIKVEADTYHTISGQITGKKIVSTPTYCKGKNPGKKNQTTDVEQTAKEAFAKWESKKKKGYVESVADAQDGKVNKAFVVGGWPPILAEKFRDHSQKIVYPCGGQPKLDGHRSTRKEGNFYSKTQKLITSLPHLSSMLSEMGLSHFPFDGELYNHDYKDDFESLSSAIRKKDPIPPEMQEVVQYHIYDMIANAPYTHRYQELQKTFDMVINKSPYARFFQLVPLEKVNSKEEALARELYWRGEEGFEGYMLRNMDQPYIHKRTVHLQKVKIYQDAEFLIVDAEEGKGKLKGKVAKFICAINDDHGPRTFKVGLKNVNLELQEQWWRDPSMWQNRMATVEFLNYTRKNVVPRHGKWARFRDMAY